jgi:hypothetical protein
MSEADDNQIQVRNSLQRFIINVPANTPADSSSMREPNWHLN